MASGFGARGLTRGELGLLLQQGPPRSALRIGRGGLLNRHIHVGWETSPRRRDLLRLSASQTLTKPGSSRPCQPASPLATFARTSLGRFPAPLVRLGCSSSSCWSPSRTSAGASRARSRAGSAAATPRRSGPPSSTSESSSMWGSDNEEMWRAHRCGERPRRDVESSSMWRASTKKCGELSDVESSSMWRAHR